MRMAVRHGRTGTRRCSRRAPGWRQCQGLRLMADRIREIWGERTPFGAGDRWPERVDEYLTVGRSEGERWVQSACVLCSNGCGMDIAVADGRIVGVRGRPGDRVNHGRLGPKGLFGWQGNNAADRLTAPLLRVGGELRETDWDTAMDAVVTRSRQVIEEHTRLAMAFYTSGQLFAEEYYTQAVIARGGIGTPHLDGNTRLCTATAEWALVESFGSDGNPGSYTDIDLCDTLFLVGHNVAETQTVLWMRMLDRLHGPDRPALAVADPRRTAAAAEADVHLAIRPGTNVAVLNAIMHELIRNGWVNHGWVDEHTVGYDELAEVAMEIFRQIEAGTIKFLWVTATNPLVSLPELGRIRSVCESGDLFLVVSDAFLTETAAIADVVLPAALWGEKTGCYTNADRTVHLAAKAVDPPGQARPDLDILLDYARRMDLKDKEGAPLLKWSTPEQAWRAFTEITRGTPCDQSALTYDKLRGANGIQWPCTDE